MNVVEQSPRQEMLCVLCKKTNCTMYHARNEQDCSQNQTVHKLNGTMQTYNAPFTKPVVPCKDRVVIIYARPTQMNEIETKHMKQNQNLKQNQMKQNQNSKQNKTALLVNKTKNQL